jgi:hypothetical protein
LNKLLGIEKAVLHARFTPLGLIEQARVAFPRLEGGEEVSMLCALESGMLLSGTIMFGLAVGFFVEEVSTRMGYKPTKLLAKWRAARQERLVSTGA